MTTTDFDILVEESHTKYGEINSYRDLLVWQKSMSLVVSVYEITKVLPQEERFGLMSQIRRAVVSVPSNISEGWGRKSTGNYIQFLRVAHGSLCETETQLTLCVMLEYIDKSDVSELDKKFDELGRMLRSLIAKLEQKKI